MMDLEDQEMDKQKKEALKKDLGKKETGPKSLESKSFSELEMSRVGPWGEINFSHRCRSLFLTQAVISP